MAHAIHSPSSKAPEREALRRRVRQMYEALNQGLWEKCYALLDPRLRKESNVAFPEYAESLRRFREVYGAIQPWYIRINLHLEASASKRDRRVFAYVYVIWQDAGREFHMFRERWVKDADRWFTRVAGLVPNRRESV